MPLPSIRLHGAKLCAAKSKRTGLPCNNPAAFSCSSCRMHGAHKSRNVARGVNSGKYKKGHFTKEAKEKTRKTIVKLRYLEDLGHQCGFMRGARTRGPKPTGYIELDLTEENKLLIALKKIQEL